MKENVTSVLVHGLGQSPSSWDAVKAYLPEAMQVHCPDLCLLVDGKDVTYKNLYKAFEDYCMSISNPIKLCGISLGAILAMNYAIDHPKKIAALVLIAPQYKMPRLLLSLQNIIFRLIPQKAFHMGFDKKQTMCLTNSMRELDFSVGIKNIGCPTLIVCGEKDNANRKAAEDIVTLSLNAELHFIDGAGHEVNTDAPKELADVINSFWQKCISGFEQQALV